jgi:hypothetical protein
MEIDALLKLSANAQTHGQTSTQASLTEAGSIRMDSDFFFFDQLHGVEDLTLCAYGQPREHPHQP